MEVKKLIACSAVAGAATMFGSGVAVADDYAGKTYADASETLSNAGRTGVISTVIGGKLPMDECMVTSSQPAPFVRDVDGGFERADREVMLSLNCNAAVASATAPGNSAASPEARAAIKLTESPTWRRQHPEWCAETATKHPESVPYLNGCFESESE
jgi:hypothetical protein